MNRTRPRGAAFRLAGRTLLVLLLANSMLAAGDSTDVAAEAAALREQYRQRLQSALAAVREQGIRELDALSRNLQQMRSPQGAELSRQWADALARGDALPPPSPRDPRELVAFRQYHENRRRQALENARRWLKSEVDLRIAGIKASGVSADIATLRALMDERQAEQAKDGESFDESALSGEQIVELFRIPKGRYSLKDNGVDVFFGHVDDVNNTLWFAVPEGSVETFSFDIASESYQGIAVEINGIPYVMSVGHWNNEGTQIVAGREIIRLKPTVRSPRRPNNLAVKLSDDRIVFLLNNKEIHAARRVVPAQSTDRVRVGFFSHTQRALIQNMVIRKR